MSNAEEFDPTVCYDVILDGRQVNENKYKALLSQQRDCTMTGSMLHGCPVASFGPSRANEPWANNFPRRNGKTSALKAWYGEYLNATSETQAAPRRKCWNAALGMWETVVNPCFGLNEKYDKVNFAPLNQKENQMKLNIETLKELAAINTKDDLSNYSKLPEGLREAMAELAKEDAKAKTKAAAMGIMSLLTTAEDRIKHNVATIRILRKDVDSFKAGINEIELARAYAEETNNFIPLGVLLGAVQVSSDEKNLAVVPADWKPLQI